MYIVAGSTDISKYTLDGSSGSVAEAKYVVKWSAAQGILKMRVRFI